MAGCVSVFPLDIFAGHTVSACLFKSVTNAKELRQQILEKQLDASFLNAEMIADDFHLLVAANKAMNGQVNNCLTTHGIHSELVYCLSGSRSIKDALAKFGIAEDSENIVMAMIDADPAKLETAIAAVKGTAAPLSDLSGLCNEEKLKKLYKITAEELAIPGSTISKCAAGRIAIRDSL